MKTNLLLKEIILKGFVILLVFVTLVNNVLVISHNTNYLKVDENNYSQFNHQALNPLEETNSLKVPLKLLVEPFSVKFYSYDYLLNKLDSHNRILRIISETVSETNLRYSSFLIAELTTST